jgi:flagellar biosynthesis/type III secretory pathway chaperone
MESKAKDIIDIYKRRISLFKDLLTCITQEKENLINQDINGLWSALEEKQKLLASIEATKNPLDGCSYKDLNFRDFSSNDKDKIRELSRMLIGLKQEIRARVRENVSFINETLDFFNEMISSLTMTETDKCYSYGPSGNSRKGLRSLMYQGEA